MKLTLAHHPDWPLLMSNSPDAPDEPVTPPPPASPATDRHNHGRAHLSHVLNWWMAQSDLSARQLSRIADWGLDERGWLHETKISYLRRNQFKERIPIRYLDAMGCANQAIWTWQCRSPHDAIAKYGPPSKDKVRPEWLNRAIWIPHPDYPSEALGPADFYDVAAGWMDIPDVARPILSPREGPQLTAELCQLLLSLVPGKSPKDQLRDLARLYPATDRERRDRFVAVLVGAGSYDRDEIEHELPVLAGIVAGLRGLTTTEYGPVELYEELTRDRAQTGGASDDD